MGLENYKAEVEKLLGYALAPYKGQDGKHHFMMFIKNGGVQDEAGKNLKNGLQEIAKVHKGTFRLTANQHLVLSDIPEEDLGLMKGLLRKYNLD
jgi:sulfite reductase (NADPH) hemoprotein beta-component